MEVILKKWGNSYGIRIPKTIIKKLELKENQVLILDDEKNKIILSKPIHLSLEERMKGFKGQFVCEEYWADIPPVGNEIW